MYASVYECQSACECCQSVSVYECYQSMYLCV